MYELKNGCVFLRLSDDLEMLEYGKENLCYRDNAPFQFSWSGIPITPKNISRKVVTASKSEIAIDFAGFIFNARFPGNTYCRPDPCYTPDLRVRISLRLDGEDLVIDISSIENIGNCTLQVMVAQGLMKASTQKKAELYIPIDYGMRCDFPRNDIFSRTYEPTATWS